MGEMLDVPFPKYSNRVSIILVRPQFDGNIGAVARSMMNFGFSDLRIVGRNPTWSEEVRNRAKHAQSVLDNAKFFDDIESAVSDTSLVVGTSGKREKGSKISSLYFFPVRAKFLPTQCLPESNRRGCKQGGQTQPPCCLTEYLHCAADIPCLPSTTSSLSINSLKCPMP